VRETSLLALGMGAASSPATEPNFATAFRSPCSDGGDAQGH